MKALPIVIYLFLIGINLMSAFQSFKEGKLVPWYTWFVMGWLSAFLFNALVKLSLI